MIRAFKKRAWFLLAMTLLFLAQVVFFDEIDFQKEDLIYAIAEFVFFGVFFTLDLCEVPRAVEVIYFLAGCIAFGGIRVWLYRFSPGIIGVVLLYLPIALFLFSQEQPTTKKPSKVWQTILLLYPTLPFLFLMFMIIRDFYTAKLMIFARVDYDCFMFPTLIVLFWSVMRTVKEKGKDKNNQSRQSREVYLSVLLILAETFFVLRVCNATRSSYTVSLIWLVVLIVLYEKEDPQLLIYKQWMEQKCASFLNGTAK